MSRLSDMSPDEREAFFDEQARERFARYDIDLQLADESLDDPDDLRESLTDVARDPSDGADLDTYMAQLTEGT